MDKTMVMKILDQKKIKYNAHYYDAQSLDAVYVATIGSKYYVFMVPANKELDLKKCAKILKEKKIEMIKQKDLEPLTGYIHGGCSPIGMKKLFPTFIDESAKKYETIFLVQVKLVHK